MLALANKLSLNTRPIYRFVNKYSIDFDGVDDRIITDGADTVAQPTTYSFWCKSSATAANNRGVFGHGSSSTGAFHFNFAGSFRPLLYLGGNYYKFWNDTPEQDDGEWHHWVVYSDTNDITNSKLYVDGVLQSESTTVSTGSTQAYGESLTIGSDQQVGGNSFEGKIDEFAVYDRELTQAEITRMYNTYYSPNRVANGNFAQIGNEEVTNGDFSQIGSEQVTNGDFATDSNWNKGTGWSVGSGKASCDGSQSSTSNLTQVNVFDTPPQTVTDNYKLTFDLVVTSGSITASSGNLSQSYTSSGSYVLYGSPEIGSGNLNFTANSTFIGSIDNVSVKQVGQDWSAKDGVITSVENGKLLFDNSSGNANGGAFQNIGLVTGKQYKMTATMQLLTGSSNGTFNLFTSSATGTGQSSVYTGSTLVVGGAAVTETFTFTPGSGDVSIQFTCDEANATYTISDITVKEVGQHWTFGTGWSTDGTKAICAGHSSHTSLTANYGFIAGRSYKVSFDITVTSGNFSIQLVGSGSDTGSVISTTTTNYTETIIPTANRTTFNIRSNDGNGVGNVDNIVVQELKHDATNLMLNAGDYQSANPLITSTKSMEFDGSDDYLQLSEPFSYTNHTITSWFKTDTNSVTQLIFDAADTNVDGVRVWFDSSARLKYRVGGDSGASTLTSPTDLEANRWYNFTCTYNGATQTMYIDGVSVGSQSATRTISTTTNATIGKGSYVDNFYVNGKITEVGAFNRALTALEVASLYNQGMPTNLLVNRNNYQSGNPTVFNTKQVDFDGSDDYMQVSNFNNLGTSDGSFSFWVNCSDFTNATFLSKFQDNDNRILFITDGSDQFLAQGRVGGSYAWNTTLGSALTSYENEWINLVVTIDRSANLTLYLNGVSYATTSISSTSSTNVDNTGDWFFGQYGSGTYFDGKMSQVGMWNSTLTADEVSSLYNHGLPIDLTTDQAAYASSSNLVGYWRMGSGTLDSYPLIADQTNATLGSELVTSWSNNDFSSFASSGSNITQMVSSGSGNNCYSSTTITSGKTYKLQFTSSQAITCQIRISPNTSLTSATVVLSSLSSGSNEVYFTAPSNYAYIGFYAPNSFTDTQISSFTLKKVQGNPAYMTNMNSTDIENGSPYANIVQNGDFATDSDWTKNSGITISGGSANFIGNSGSYLYQNMLDTGKQYFLSFDISVYTSGALTIFGGAGNNISSTFNVNATGTYTGYFTAGGSDTNIYFGNLFVGSIDNVTVEEVNTGLQGYWKMGDGTNDEYPVIYDQTNPTLGSNLTSPLDFTTWTNSTATDITANSFTTSGSGQGVFYNLTTNKVYQINISGVTGDISIRYRDGGGAGTVLGAFDTDLYFNTSGLSSPNIYIRSLSATTATVTSVSIKEVQGNPAVMTNMLEGNITNQYPLTKIRNYYRMGDGILDGYPIIQDQTSPNLAHIPTTNNANPSEVFTGWSLNAVTVTTNTVVSPDGTQNASTATPTTANSVHLVSTTGTNTVAMSIYAKQNGYTRFRFNSGSSGNGYASFNLSTGVVAASGGTYLFDSGIEDVGNGWFRCFMVLRGGSATNMTIAIEDNSGGVSFAGDGTSGIHIWGAQSEDQLQPTTYLKSDGIAAVRKATTTNLISYSEDFSQASQLQNVTLTANAITSPTGTSNGTKVLSSDNNSKVSYQNISFTNGTTYTLSVYCRNIDATALKLFVYNSGGGDITDDFTSQVNTTSWTRVSTTFTASQTTSSGQVQFARELPNGQSAYFWGLQLEEQTQAETYAKTTGLPVTIDLFTENNYGTMTNMSASDIVEDTP